MLTCYPPCETPQPLNDSFSSHPFFGLYEITDDFRIFAGNLGKDCTDSLLEASFSRFKGFHMARVVSDPKTRKNKGFGFVSFLDPQGYLDAMRDMQGKFVGSHPLILRKSKWRERSSTNAKSAKKQHLW
jgi:RNA recognition motif-containing protein